MEQRIFTNNATSTLQGSISDSDTLASIAGADAALFPEPTGDQFFLVTLENRLTGDIEIVKCTDRNVADLTIERGEEGTTPVAFPAGTIVSVRTTAELLQVLVDETREIRAHWLSPGPDLPTTDDNGEPLADGAVFFKDDDGTLWMYYTGVWSEIPFGAASTLSLLDEDGLVFSDIRKWNYRGALVTATQDGGDAQQGNIDIGPADFGDVNQVLQTNGVDTVSWANISVPTALDDLTDVEVPAPSNGDVLIYDSAAGKWVNGATGAPETSAQAIRWKPGGTEKTVGIVSVTKTATGRWTVVVDNAYIPDIREAYFTSFSVESAESSTSLVPNQYGSWTSDTMYLRNQRNGGSLVDGAYWAMVIWPDEASLSGGSGGVLFGAVSLVEGQQGLSGVSTIAFTSGITSSYYKFELRLRGSLDVDEAGVALRFSTDAGSTWLDDPNSYSSRFSGRNVDNFDADFYHPDDQEQMHLTGFGDGDGVGNAANEYLDLVIELSELSATGHKSVYTRGGYSRAGSPTASWMRVEQAGLCIATTLAVDAVQILFTGGAVFTGDAYLVGHRKSA